jgi:hypothetical protein
MTSKCLPAAYPIAGDTDTMRVKLTPAFVMKAPLPETGDRVVYWDATQSGFGLVVTRNGARSYVFQYRNAQQISRRWTWSATDLSLDKARKEAKKLAGDVVRGGDPVAEKRRKKSAATTTLKAVCEEYLIREGGMKRGADGNATFEGGNIRSADQRLKVFERLIYPKLGPRQIDDIKRSEIVTLLDKIQDERGPQAAHQALAFLSKTMNWHASRSDHFRSPIVRGMGRVKPRERAGKRVLSDEEIRDVWAALDAGTEDIPACFPALVRTLLLTATRRDEAAQMCWPEIQDDLWTVPAARMKGKLDHVVPLTSPMIAIIGQKPAGAKDIPTNKCYDYGGCCRGVIL